MRRFLHLAYFSVAISSVPAYAAPDLSDAEVCRATIAAVMGRDPRIVQIDEAGAEYKRLSYVRTSDSTQWKYLCRVWKNEVQWASPTGRWQGPPTEAAITFTQSADEITIRQKHPDGSDSTNTYKKSVVAVQMKRNPGKQGR